VSQLHRRAGGCYESRVPRDIVFVYHFQSKDIRIKLAGCAIEATGDLTHSEFLRVQDGDFLAFGK
jgi:hypothetical protein